MKIHVREALASDREAVFEFCRKTWSWGDYIPHVWDKWLMEENGKVFVATIDGAPVGISHVTIDKPGEAWLSGARTAPNFRRMGIASAIAQKCLEYAKSRGAKVARLVTESDNKAAIAAVQTMDFKPVAEFVEMTLEKPVNSEELSACSRWARKSEAEVVWSFLETSEVYREAAGLYTVLYHWFSLNRRDVERFVAEGKAIICLDKADGGKICGLTLVEDAPSREWHENTLQTCYIDGDFNAVLDMAKFLKAHCAFKNVEKIYGFTCNHKPIITALEKLGFKPPESTAIIFQKQI
ncbi:GNAT family N-acetyltransferase [Candidatus Bathyarchaeota archaeon]|nr:GNAT family N-acetyltransferase [Candidatus Bathyarchaeota archaeon]